MGLCSDDSINRPISSTGSFYKNMMKITDASMKAMISRGVFLKNGFNWTKVPLSAKVCLDSSGIKISDAKKGRR